MFLDSVEDEEQIDRIMKIKIDIGNSVNGPISNFSENSYRAIQTCPVVITLVFDNPKLIQNVQITFCCVPPIVSSVTTLCLDDINGTEILENFIFLLDDSDISDFGINLGFTIVQNDGKIKFGNRRIVLPINFYCEPVEIVMESNYKIDIKINGPVQDVSEMFSGTHYLCIIF